MSRITLDADLRAKLNGLNEQVEVCDEAGHTLGRFVPENLYKKMLYTAVTAACPYTEEELEQFRQEKGGRTLAEIWKSLGQA